MDTFERFVCLSAQFFCCETVTGHISQNTKNFKRHSVLKLAVQLFVVSIKGIDWFIYLDDLVPMAMYIRNMPFYIEVMPV